MSHFTVMVAVSDTEMKRAGSPEMAVEPRLAPFHEYESTGVDDQYVETIDITDEARQTYDNNTTTRIKCPDGTLVSAYDDAGMYKPEFCRTEPMFEGSTVMDRTLHIPDGYEQVSVPTKDVESFEDFVAGYYGYPVLGKGNANYGYIVLDEHGDVAQVIRRTNPNSKWDWWTVGGRWSGLFEQPDGRAVDAIQKRDWNYQQQIDEARQRYGRYWDDIQAATEGLPAFKTFEQLHAEMGDAPEPTREEVREELTRNSGIEPTEDALNRAFERAKCDKLRLVRPAYHSQPVVEALKTVKRFDSPSETIVDEWMPDYDKYLTGDRETFVEREAFSAIGSFALIDLDGNWVQRGKMGWFAMVSDADSQWPKPALAVLDALPDDAWLVNVDCHI
jgi:hypothetical protein